MMDASESSEATSQSLENDSRTSSFAVDAMPFGFTPSRLQRVPILGNVKFLIVVALAVMFVIMLRSKF
jgi:hypothetical protein